MNTVVIEKNRYIYKGKGYEENEIESIIKKCGKSIRIIILAENPLIKICEKTNKNVYKSIEKEVVNNLIIDEDTLVNYLIDKKLKTIYIYSIKQGIKVSRILSKADKMIVEPIQYILINIIKKKFKYKRDYQAIVRINGYIYFISVQNGKLVYSKTIEDKENATIKLCNEELIGDNFLVDIELKNIILDNILENKNLKNANFINLKEKVEYEISKV